MLTTSLTEALLAFSEPGGSSPDRMPAATPDKPDSFWPVLFQNAPFFGAPSFFIAWINFAFSAGGMAQEVSGMSIDPRRMDPDPMDADPPPLETPKDIAPAAALPCC